MGAVFVRSRRLRSTPAASLLALGGLLLSTSPTAFQDMAALVADADAKLRWQAYLVAAPHGSVHAASLGFVGQGPEAAVSIRRAALGDPVAIAAEQLRRELGKNRQTVNRDSKADLLMTRVARAAPQRQARSAGQLGRVEDFFSAHGPGVLTRISLQPPRHGDPAELMLAYARFLKPEPDLDVGNMLANRRRSPFTVTPATDESVAPTLVAYAPTERHVDAPFEAVIGRQPKIGTDAETEAEIEAAALPRMRPDRYGGDDDVRRHSWAMNPLPEDVHDDDQQLCLARAIYFEARGESPVGQAAVAQVVLNRVKNPAYPKTICGVVYQNRNWRNRCQFSFACDGKPERIRAQTAWSRAKDLARDVTNGKVWLRAVGDSTHYHATYVSPRWARFMKRTDRIGRHIFYRTHGGGWS
jgi:spore germination cell wall hydrolase CwlJ-like protein